MLKSITIDRFKSVKNAKVEFGNVNLFIGGNGAGKSNVLEAIGVVAAALSRGVDDNELARKGVRLTPPTLMKSAFKGEDLPKTLRIETIFDNELSYDIGLKSGQYDHDLGFFTESCSYKNERLFGQSNAGARVYGDSIPKFEDRHRSLWDRTRSAFDYPEKIVAEFDALSRYAIYAPQTEFLRETRTGRVSSPPIGLHGEGLAQAVAGLIEYWNKLRYSAKRKNSSEADLLNYKIIQSAINLAWLPGWTRGFRVGDINPLLRSRDSVTSDGEVVYFVDKYMHEKRNTLAAYDSSEGTLFLLFLAILLAHPASPRIFALDNIDNALNPSVSKSMLSAMIDIVAKSSSGGSSYSPKQVFLTSHNPTTLDAFDLFDPLQRVFVVQRNDKGHSTVTRLKPREGWTRDDWYSQFKGKKLSQLWIDGEIRGGLTRCEVI